MTNYANDAYIYNFINFNYTFLLDQGIGAMDKANIIHRSSRGENIRDRINIPLHIHGTYLHDLLLGVNDESQVANKSLLEERRLTQLFIKPKANSFSKTGIHESCENIIKNSRIIVIFGMSLGKTDASWWEMIISWLRAEGNRQLVIFQYRDKYNAPLRESYVDCVEDVYLTLQDYGLTAEIRETVESRIHIEISNNLLGSRII